MNDEREIPEPPSGDDIWIMGDSEDKVVRIEETMETADRPVTISVEARNPKTAVEALKEVRKEFKNE